MAAAAAAHPSFCSLIAKPLLFPLLLSLFLSPLQLALSKVHLHKWDISYQFKSPDCLRKLAITVNGETPGPTIYAQQGDTVVVQVNNSLVTENTAIHWHGIRQIGTPWFDGTEGVTQCPILPGDTFVYRFTVDRPGTYLYHAHYGMQRSAGLYGLIQVAVPDGVAEPFAYDYDRSIVLNDWWHNSTQEQATGLTSIPIVWVGEPQSILINGRGSFNCSLSGPNQVCNATNPECSPFVLAVVPGKTYRLRIASVTSLSAFNFEIEGHNLTVVEADGHYAKPFVVENLNIYSGETYSVLFTADRDPGRNYWLAVNVVSRKPGTPVGTGILNYYPNHPRRLPPSSPPSGPPWNDTEYRFNQSKALRSHPAYVHPPPPAADRSLLLLNTQNKVEGRVRWSINNVSFNMPHTPYLIALKKGLRHAFDQAPAPETYDYRSYDIYINQTNPNATISTSIYRLEFNSTVDVVLQNANMMNPNTSDTHPWHLHGHDFWVLGFGMGKFVPGTDEKEFNLVDPIMKNTVAVHQYGWTAIRFRADNPGAWAFHCHIESHFFMGMGVVFAEGVDRVGRLPTSIMGCGHS
ncbi:L-ascorbate oxidase-like [Zingiber officinale]|nr:L-ascorbate oxidase-like [Zingiber officinale]